MEFHTTRRRKAAVALVALLFVSASAAFAFNPTVITLVSWLASIFLVIIIIEPGLSCMNSDAEVDELE